MIAWIWKHLPLGLRRKIIATACDFSYQEVQGELYVFNLHRRGPQHTKRNDEPPTFESECG